MKLFRRIRNFIYPEEVVDIIIPIIDNAVDVQVVETSPGVYDITVDNRSVTDVEGWEKAMEIINKNFIKIP